MIPLDEAREILGRAADGRTDEEIARLVEFADLVAEWSIEASDREIRIRQSGSGEGCRGDGGIRGKSSSAGLPNSRAATGLQLETETTDAGQSAGPCDHGNLLHYRPIDQPGAA